MSDLIDRQQAIDAILHITNCKSVRELFEYNQAHHLTEMWSGGVNDAIDAVIGVESATDKKVGTTDTISRQAAIDALKTDMASLDHIIKGMSGYDVRLDAYVSQRNQVNCDIDTISNLPPAQPETATVTIGRTKGDVTMWYECDACGEPIDQNDCYCRKCGRKLKYE